MMLKMRTKGKGRVWTNNEGTNRVVWGRRWRWSKKGKPNGQRETI